MIHSATEQAATSKQGLFAASRSWLIAHPLIAYAIRRFIAYLVTLWGAFTVTFFFFRLIPGNPIGAYVQSLQQKQMYNAQASQDMVKYYKTVFGLDGNLFEQYIHYLQQIFIKHDLGPSILSFPTSSQV